MFPPKEDNRVCNKFEGCVIPLLECLFSMIDFRLTFNDSEVDVLNHLGVSPSKLHLMS